jgi:4'-phosphopantetheinyl transferase
MLILFTRLEDNSSSYVSFSLQTKVPASVIARENSFLRAKDKARFITGRHLLLKGLELLGCTRLSLEDIILDKYQKPGFGKPPYFNISHSGKLVVCALSLSGSIGVDTEVHREIAVGTYASFFSVNEFRMIQEESAPNLVNKTFFRFWCRKEALIKADGRGLGIPLHTIDVSADHIKVDNKFWELRDIELHPSYSACVVSENFNSESPVIQQLFL